MAKYQLFNEWLKNNKDIQEVQGNGEWPPERRGFPGILPGVMNWKELVAGYSDNLEHNELLTIMPELVKRALKELYPQDPEYQTIFRMIVETNPPRYPEWWPAFKDKPEEWISEKAKKWQAEGTWEYTAKKLQRR